MNGANNNKDYDPSRLYDPTDPSLVEKAERGNIKCYFDYHYNEKFRTLWQDWYIDQTYSSYYINDMYTNTTTGHQEVFCVRQIEWKDNCDAVEGFQTAVYKASLTALQRSIYDQTTGCRKCAPDFVHRVERLAEVGLDKQWCQSTTIYDYS